MKLQTKGPEKPPAPKQWAYHFGPVMGTVLFTGHGRFSMEVSGRCLVPGSRERVASPGFPISHETQDESLNLSVFYFLLKAPLATFFPKLLQEPNKT